MSTDTPVPFSNGPMSVRFDLEYFDSREKFREAFLSALARKLVDVETIQATWHWSVELIDFHSSKSLGRFELWFRFGDLAVLLVRCEGSERAETHIPWVHIRHADREKGVDRDALLKISFAGGEAVLQSDHAWDRVERREFSGIA